MAEPPGSAAPERSSAPPSSDELLGRVIDGRFTILGVIARGGMGRVYRARQEPLGREVALKILHPKYTGDLDPDFQKRFFLEAATCAKLRHPNTVTVFDYGRTHDDVYYIVMELLEGRPLHRRLKEGPLSAPEAVSIGEQICRSLREAHALGLIHRDLKPANIFLVAQAEDEGPFAKVLDFGLVKDLDDPEDMTQTGLFMGSPKYMSPEHISGDPLDARSDIYSLGVLLYQMLCGKAPFSRDNVQNVLLAHVNRPPPTFAERAPDVPVPAPLQAIVLRCLAKRREDRFPSMNALLQELKRASLELGYRASRTSLDPDSTLGGRWATATMSSSGPVLQHPGALAEPLVVEEPTKVEPSDPPPLSPPAPPPAEARPAPTPLPPAERRLPFLRLFAGVLVLGALITLGAFMAFPGVGEEAEGPPPSPEMPAAGSTPAAAPAPDPDAPPEVPAAVRVALRSIPPGAAVYVEGDDTPLGTTPTDLEWTGEEAEAGREIQLRFHLAGHVDRTVIRRVEGDALHVEVTLEPVPRPPPEATPPPSARPPRDRRPRRRPSPPAPALGDYRSDPY
jgi:serine/threonine protein kinase